VKNEDLWRALEAAASRHEVEWKWVKGHADDVMNNRADELARSAIKTLRV
jgi:ribonuclease HI